jgi:hypothetical protein
MIKNQIAGSDLVFLGLLRTLKALKLRPFWRVGFFGAPNQL